MTFNMLRIFPRLIKPLALGPRILVEQRKYIHCYQCRLQLKSLLVTNNFISRELLLGVPESEMVIKRYYAKGKDKKKDKGKQKLDESVLVDIINVDKMHKEYQHFIENLKEDYAKNLSLRSTTGSIETLPVKFEGNEYNLQELAQIIRQNPKSIILNMASFPQAIPAVLQSLEKSGMNLNPQQDGTKLFIPVPKVTKELRETLAKNAKTMFIKCRTNLKDVQNKLIKSIKNKEKTDNLAADISRSASDQVTAVCDLYVTEADKIFTTKQLELKGETN